MKYVKTILIVLSILIVVMSLIPLIRHDYWTFRVFEYPRFQKFILTLIFLGIFLFFWNLKNWKDTAVGIALILNTGYLLYLIVPFTPIGSKQMLSVEKKIPDKSISLMVSNVYQYNRNAEGLLEIIKKHNPDMLLLVETDLWWMKALEKLEEDYPHTVYQPQSNTYGMLLYSRLPLKDVSVKFLIEYGIPSIHTKAVLKSGDLVQFYFIHPEPPVPDKDTRSTERDAEILMVGKMAKKNKLPVVVAGDLNDVAWSYTTELFQQTSGMLDPRRGRGFYNTFHAKHPLMRWPLDHIFCSTDFKLVELKKLEKFGSDHFPIMIDLTLAPDAAKEQQAPQPEKDVEGEANEKIEKGKKMQKQEEHGED